MCKTRTHFKDMKILANKYMTDIGVGIYLHLNFYFIEYGTVSC